MRRHISKHLKSDAIMIVSVQISVNCEYEAWGNWTTCTKSCDGGEQTRQRGIKTAAAYGGAECSGDSKETQSCNTQKCPSMYAFVF